ncbi:prevent-host-death protein [Azorhizobium caulinodans ORS 571]|uniref:Antitoxin n=1 Tax=Azorhizobium caulinodans (strain ATCC 43989 / DSM 5975 / JCM 20966 / LMG 6465 / NBRC 14845 / NCIMB 13405 / ORS 571) TaxID=438753 RepID=A8IMX3_AZOC5|nr:type II toxin-antitoxin system prevent-host-death family antitoxin [Azorhizobium caulinodans]BAF89671.1 prevent-host-death protein [Azorhizobium caulinodans ORS 571]
MRHVQITDAEAHLTQLVDAVERGETVVITRDGRAVARLVPEPDHDEAGTRKTMEAIAAFRETMPRLSLADIQSARREGHQR